MRCYAIRDAQVTVLADTPTSPVDEAELIYSVKDLDQNRFPVVRLVAIWNALPSSEPVRRFRDRSVALKRLWAALEALPISSTQTESKQAQLIALLKRPDGASMEDLISVTGWQRHSIRGVLSGVVRKKLGLPLATSREGGQLIYRLVA